MSPPPPNPSSGRSAVFIVLEGIDGSGTTTQLERLTRHLRDRGRAVLPTREPSIGPVGRLVREILLGQHRDERGAAFDGRAMALLFAADRRDHLMREIEPALAQGTDVVSDRYVLSSLAYQDVEAEHDWVERLADGIRTPDLTLVLDTPIEVAADRRHRAGRPSERYDADATLARVAENYRRLAAAPRRSANVVLVDGSATVEQVEQDVAAEVDRLFERRRLF
jgi:dTMP kinase